MTARIVDFLCKLKSYETLLTQETEIKHVVIYFRFFTVKFATF